MEAGAEFFLAAAKFVGFGFYLSLAILWLLVQGYIWLAERYSRLISKVRWWKSGLITLLVTLSMVAGWSIPYWFAPAGNTPALFHSLTSAICLGTVVSWILCGRLYQLDALNRAVVALGIPVLSLLATVAGQIWYWKLFGK